MRATAAALLALLLLAAAIVAVSMWLAGSSGARTPATAPEASVALPTKPYRVGADSTGSRTLATPTEPAPADPDAEAEPAAPAEPDSEPPPVVLHVLDRDTDRPLVDAIVAREPDHPFPREGAWEEHVIVQGTSPLAIPAALVSESNYTTLFVRAAGYAWREMLVQGYAARTIRLARAGELEVLVGGERIDGAFVRVRRALPTRRPTGTSVVRWEELTQCGGELVREAEWGDSLPMRFSSLAVGEYVARVEVGSPFYPPVVLATTAVEITDGGLRQARLSPLANPLPSKVRTAFTVRFAPGWRRSTTVCFEQEGALFEHSAAGVDPGAGTFQFELDLFPGRYDVHFLHFGFSSTCNVNLGGAHPIHLEVPAPVPVVVTVLDADTGEPVPATILVGYFAVFERGEEIALAPGRYRLLACSIGHHDVAADVEVTGAGSAYVLKTTRKSGVKVTLCENDVDLPNNWRWEVSLRNVDGSNAVIPGCSDNSVIALPGTYTLLVEDVDGYEPIPPRQVVVEAAKWTEVTIPVEPSRR